MPFRRSIGDLLIKKGFNMKDLQELKEAVSGKKTYILTVIAFLLFTINESYSIPFFNVIFPLVVAGGGVSMRLGIKKVQDAVDAQI